MLDIKIPNSVPFKQQMLMCFVYGAMTGVSFGVAIFALTFLAWALKILPQH